MSWNAPNLPADKHRFFDRHGGVSNGRYESLNVNRKSADTPENIRQNINIAAGAFGMTAAAAAFPCQDVTGHAEYKGSLGDRYTLLPYGRYENGYGQGRL